MDCLWVLENVDQTAHKVRENKTDACVILTSSGGFITNSKIPVLCFTQCLCIGLGDVACMMNSLLLFTKEGGGALPCDASMRQSTLTYGWTNGLGDLDLVSI